MKIPTNIRELLYSALYDLDGAVYTRAKASRLGQQNFLGIDHDYSTPMILTSNVTGWPASGWLKSNSTAPSSRTCTTVPA